MSPPDQLTWLKNEIDQIVKRYAGYSDGYLEKGLEARAELKPNVEDPRKT